VVESKNRPELVYSVRIFPIQEATADRLETEFSDIASIRRFLPRMDGWNLVLDINDEIDVQPIVNALRREGLETNFDVFVSLVPERDSLIGEIPRNVIRLIQEFGCPTMVSYTSGAWGAPEE